MGRRVSKKVYTYSAGSWVENSTVLFLYDGWNLIAELDEAGEPVASYVWGLDLSQSLQGAGGVGGLLARIDHGANKAHHYFYDGNGNVGQLVDSADGALGAAYEYDPFGDLSSWIGEYAEVNPFRFSTKYFDGESGFYYYGYRYFAPEVGRWVNKDLLGERGGINLYHFVFNNPLCWIDYHGLWGDGNKGNGNADPASRGHSDFPGHDIFNYTKEDHDKKTSPFNPESTWRHFQPLKASEANLVKSTTECDKDLFERSAHQMQDFFSHYGQGYRAEKDLNYWTLIESGHGMASAGSSVARASGFGEPRPDNAIDYQYAYVAAKERTAYWVGRWKKCCCGSGDTWVKLNGRSGSDCSAKAPYNPWGENAPLPTPEKGYWREGWDMTTEAAEWTLNKTMEAGEWTWDQITWGD